MKSSSYRIILSTLLVLASFCSYAYLNMVSIDHVVLTNPAQEQTLQTEESEQEEIYLPDVEIIKKAVETGKKALSIATGLTR